MAIVDELHLGRLNGYSSLPHQTLSNKLNQCSYVALVRMDRCPGILLANLVPMSYEVDLWLLRNGECTKLG
jgi:hypothetical protein